MSTIVKYSFEDGLGGQTLSPESASQLSVSDISSKDGNISYVSGNPGWAISENAWNNPTPDNYFSFTITPTEEAWFTVSSIEFDHSRSTDGPPDWSIRTSEDSFASDIATGINHQENVWHSESESLDNTYYDPVEIRIYGLNGTEDNGVWRIDNLTINGTVFPEESSSSESSQTSSQSTSSSIVDPSSSSSSVSTVSSSSWSTHWLTRSSSSSESSSSSSSSSSSNDSTTSLSTYSDSSFSRSESSTSNSCSTFSYDKSSSESSESSSSSRLLGWNLNSIDIDIETGEAYVTAYTSWGESQIFKINSVNTKITGSMFLPRRETPRAAYVEQSIHDILPFYFEVASNKKTKGDLNFTFDATQGDSNIDTNSWSVAGGIGEDLEISHLPEKDILVWYKGEAGVVKTKAGVDKTFEAAEYVAPENAIKLPVFSWESTPYVASPAFLVADTDGGLHYYSYNSADGLTEILSMGAAFLPFQGETINGFSTSPQNSKVLLSTNRYLSIFDTDSGYPIESIHLNKDVELHSQNLNDTAWGIMKSSGKVFSLQLTPPENNSSSSSESSSSTSESTLTTNVSSETTDESSESSSLNSSSSSSSISSLTSSSWSTFSLSSESSSSSSSSSST